MSNRCVNADETADQSPGNIGRVLLDMHHLSSERPRFDRSLSRLDRVSVPIGQDDILPRFHA